MRQRVVVVGAGPGGLAVAMLLARAGAEVTVIERHERVGGRSATIEQDGFRFDLGPTFFLYPRILDEIFKTCGRSLREEVELIQLEPMYRLVFENGGFIRATSDLERLRAEVAKISPEDAQRLPDLMADNQAKLEAFQPVLERPFTSVLSLLSLSMLKSLRRLRPHRSIDQDLSRHFKDPRVRLGFSFQSKYLGMSPFNCPSLFTILSYLEYAYGVFHPKGGCGAVMEAMARVARDLGVRIETGEAVEEVLFSGRRAVGVRTTTGMYACDRLVINADFANAMRRLVPDRLRRRWSDARIAKKRFSCSTFMMYLGIEGEVPLDHHTIFLAEDYARNLREIEERRVLPEHPSLYVQNACVTDPGQAPDGHSTLYALVPVPHQSSHIDWAQERERYRAVTLRRLGDLGVPDLEQRIVSERIVTPADWETDMQLHKGATFNLAHNLGQMLHRRPRNRFEDLEAVYLVGGGTHPGSGLPVIFEGARITAKLLAEDLKLPGLGSTALPVDQRTSVGRVAEAA